jgi:hypothetical protein
VVGDRLVTAWLLTLPAAAVVAGAFYFVTDEIGTRITGPLVVSLLAALAALAAGALFVQTHRSSPVTARDV